MYYLDSEKYNGEWTLERPKMKFTDLKNDTPRLVVLYKHGADGTDQFQWGIVGAIPLLTLIGSIVRVQSDVVNQLAEQHNECPEQAFVMAFDGADMSWFVHRNIPVDPLVGMLEAIKGTLVGSRTAQQVASNKTQLLGPDGRPMSMGMA